MYISVHQVSHMLQEGLDLKAIQYQYYGSLFGIGTTVLVFGGERVNVISQISRRRKKVRCHQNMGIGRGYS